MSSTDSCGDPLRQLALSMPSPVTAPPRVMVRSCGTHSGTRPWGRVAATRSSYVVIPSTSAVRRSASTSRTPEKADTSRPGVLVGLRGRNRLEVRLASRTGAPGGMAAYFARRSSTAAA